MSSTAIRTFYLSEPAERSFAYAQATSAENEPSSSPWRQRRRLVKWRGLVVFIVVNVSVMSTTMRLAPAAN